MNEEIVMASDSRQNHSNTKTSWVKSEVNLGARFKFNT